MQELPENDTTDLARVQQFSLRDTLSPQSRAAFDEADRKLREYDRLEQEGKIPPPTEAQRAIMRHMQYG